MSYDINYYSKETWDKPYEERKIIKVAPFQAEGGTVRAELVDGVLVPSKIEECELNITYNYSPYYREHIDSELGIRWIYGKTGEEVKDRLVKAVQKLGCERDTSPFWQVDTKYTIGRLFEESNLPDLVSEAQHKEYMKVEDWDNHPNKERLARIGYLRDGGSYWKATPGNAGHPLMRILTWIIQNPDGVFSGD